MYATMSPPCSIQFYLIDRHPPSLFPSCARPPTHPPTHPLTQSLPSLPLTHNLMMHELLMVVLHLPLYNSSPVASVCTVSSESAPTAQMYPCPTVKAVGW